MLKTVDLSKSIEGIFLFKANSGITLYSKTKHAIQEDMFSAFLSALKGFFTNLDLGGLSSFSSEDYFIYLTSSDNVLTALIVNIENKSDIYFKLGYEICKCFYNEFKSVVNNSMSFFIPKREKFDSILQELLDNFDKSIEHSNQLLSIYTINSSEDLIPLPFENELQLFNLELFIIINSVVKKIFVIENSNRNVSSRKLYLANKAATSLNQRDYKSEYTIRQVSDNMDFERIILLTGKLLRNEAYNI